MQWKTELTEDIMAGYLIKETTKEEREKIEADSIANIEPNWYDSMSGLTKIIKIKKKKKKKTQILILVKTKGVKKKNGEF